MTLLTGTSAFIGREEVLREMRREHAILSRVSRREKHGQNEARKAARRGGAPGGEEQPLPEVEEEEA